MRLHEELAGSLPEVPDLVLHGLPHNVVAHGLQVHAALVREVVKHICSADGLGSYAKEGRNINTKVHATFQRELSATNEKESPPVSFLEVALGNNRAQRIRLYKVTNR